MPTLSEHPFAPFVRILGKGKHGSRNLTEQEAFDAFSMILHSKATDAQVGAFMMLLRVKEESPEELCGFVRATKDDIRRRFSSQQVDLDWSSYAGKRKHHAWYLLAALTLAKHGVRVLMHGASGHTAGRVYSEALLTELGQPVIQAKRAQHAVDEQIANALDTQCFCYLPMRVMQPTLQRIIDMRGEFGLRSPVHTLARLINPFDAACSLQSIFHPSYQPSHVATAAHLGYQNTLVIKGDGGEFERNPDARTRVMGLNTGTPFEFRLPTLNDSKSPSETNLSAQMLQDVWQGEQAPSYALQAITETIALALMVLGKANNYAGAQVLAQDMWRGRHSEPN